MKHYIKIEGRKRQSLFGLMSEMWAGPEAVELTPPPTPEENWDTYRRNIAGYFRVACGHISPEMQAEFDREQEEQEEIRQAVHAILAKRQRKAKSKGKAHGKAKRQN